MRTNQWVRSPKIQSDSESSGNDVEINSATEISTDSEFDHDEITRETPKIFIDDTHLKRPTKVQIKQKVITPKVDNTKYLVHNQVPKVQRPAKKEPQFKPLVQVDPSLLISKRTPLQNPRPGDYLLNKTSSTEGIASKKSLELKKRYLLGEQANGNKIQKSGSTSILDSKIRSFHSNISECQKLLNPSSDISPTMKTFLNRTKLGQTNRDNLVTELLEKGNSNEGGNTFVNSKNEMNKGIEYIETANTTLLGAVKQAYTEPTIVETIDLTSPEKIPIYDLTQTDNLDKTAISNTNRISKDRFESENVKENNEVPDNRIIDLTVVLSDKSCEENSDKPNLSIDQKGAIPDIIRHTEELKDDNILLVDHESEKKDSPEKVESDIQETSIHVPNIPWISEKNNLESDSISSSSSSSVEDIQHFILDSTTSPETQAGQIVPRLEVHDSSGTLMQIDSLMIIDGKYIGDMDDLKDVAIPPGIILPSSSVQSSSPVNPIIEKKIETPPQKPTLQFDTRNENKIDTLKNIPLIIDQGEDHNRVIKPISLSLKDDAKDVDNDKTPTADKSTLGSDSEVENTNQVLTETELSDWTADDALSENFIDVEFALNSNKGTIKRNKKLKKRTSQSGLVVSHETRSGLGAKRNPNPEPCGILRNLDIEEIEFMDTGSEGSCAEVYSATNTTLILKHTGRDISQNQNHTANDNNMKTPVNEDPSLLSLQGDFNKSQSPPHKQDPHSFTENTNEADDDSLFVLTTFQDRTFNSNITPSTTNTTEASDILTVITSPEDSTSPKTQLTDSNSGLSNRSMSPNKASPSATSSSNKSSLKKSSNDDVPSQNSTKRKDSEEISYEEYVRKLQHKITQISNARDSSDLRKQGRRKSSKGDTIETNSVIEANEKGSKVNLDVSSKSTDLKNPVATFGIVAKPVQEVHKIPEILTLSRKLEELTKERTKQKDLIHDLVMDKLQIKKQQNAEKRLNRSRNRTMLGRSLTASSLSPIPKSLNIVPVDKAPKRADDRHSIDKENTILVEDNSKIAPKTIKDVEATFPESIPRTSRLRPFSENYEVDNHDAGNPMCKLSKTQSFSYSTRQGGLLKNEAKHNLGQVLNISYETPTRPFKPTYGTDELTSNSTYTDVFRSEARARARLKSNHDLGLSPEEKLHLLRKRYNLDKRDVNRDMQNATANNTIIRKMVSSKSFNDIASEQLTQQHLRDLNNKPVELVADFTSDPNLSNTNTPTSIPSKLRRPKDPERRKSIIHTFSSFFHKGKKDKDEGHFTSVEQNTPNSASVATGDGMFSRFRISPRSKQKSMDTSSSSTPQYKYGHYQDKTGNSHEMLRQGDRISTYASSPQLFKEPDDQIPPPIPPLPLNYQRSDDESYATETKEQKKQRAISKAARQAELKRLRIAQEIQREQEEIEVQLKELEARGVLIEKALRGEGQSVEKMESNMGVNDEKLLKELLAIWRNITQLKKRDEELGIRQQELQLEHRHAQLKEELNIRLSGSKLEKSSDEVAAEGAILNEMLEIVAKRAALRPSTTATSPANSSNSRENAEALTFRGCQSNQNRESNI